MMNLSSIGRAFSNMGHSIADAFSSLKTALGKLFFQHPTTDSHKISQPSPGTFFIREDGLNALEQNKGHSESFADLGVTEDVASYVKEIHDGLSSSLQQETKLASSSNVKGSGNVNQKEDPDRTKFFQIFLSMRAKMDEEDALKPEDENFGEDFVKLIKEEEAKVAGDTTKKRMKIIMLKDCLMDSFISYRKKTLEEMVKNNGLEPNKDPSHRSLLRAAELEDQKKLSVILNLLNMSK